MKGIEGFMVFNKEVIQNIDTIKPLLLDENNHSRTWEDPTLKSDRIKYQLRFEVMDRLSLSEISH